MYHVGIAVARNVLGSDLDDTLISDRTKHRTVRHNDVVDIVGVILAVLLEKLHKLHIDLPIRLTVCDLLDHVLDLGDAFALNVRLCHALWELADAEQVGCGADIEFSCDADTINELQVGLVGVQSQTSADHLRVETGISCRSGDNDRFDQGHIRSLGEDHAVDKARYLSLGETLDDLCTVGGICRHHNSAVDQFCNVVSVLDGSREYQCLTDCVFTVCSSDSLILQGVVHGIGELSEVQVIALFAHIAYIVTHIDLHTLDVGQITFCWVKLYSAIEFTISLSGSGQIQME